MQLQDGARKVEVDYFFWNDLSEKTIALGFHNQQF